MWGARAHTVERAEPFLEEVPQPADEAGERVGADQDGGKLGDAILVRVRVRVRVGVRVRVRVRGRLGLGF